MTTRAGPMTIDQITHEQYKQGNYLRPDEEPFYYVVSRRKKIRPGRFKKKIEVDHQIFALTEEHVIVVEFDLFHGYYISRFPYGAIDELVLSGKSHIAIYLFKVDNFTLKLGDDAPRIHDEIQKRRDANA